MTQARIVVAQTYEDILEEVKERISGCNPHKISYVSAPADVVEIAMQEPVDIVVTGECFYNTDLKSLSEALAVYVAGPLEASKHFWPKRGGSMSGGDIARAVHSFRPNALVLRYSLTPNEDPYAFGINGDINKYNHPNSLVEFLEDRELKQIVGSMDWGALRERHPKIRLYSNLPGGQ